MKYLALGLLMISPTTLHAQHNRWGQPRAVTVNRIIKVTPTLIVPGAFIQGYPTTIDVDQLRANRRERYSRWRRRRL